LRRVAISNNLFIAMSAPFVSSNRPTVKSLFSHVPREDPRKSPNQDPRALLQPNTRQAYLVFGLISVLEVFDSVMPGLIFVLDGDSPWIIWGFAYWIRFGGFLGVSILVNRQRWWTQWRRLDAIFCFVLASCFSYGLAAYTTARDDGNLPLDSWRIHSIVGYPFLIFSYSGAVRVLVKWYPWSRGSAFVYKCLLLFHTLAFVFVFVWNDVAMQIKGPTLGYYASVLSVFTYLLGMMLTKERAVKDQLKREAHYRDEEKGAGSSQPLFEMSREEVQAPVGVIAAMASQ